MFNPLFPNVAKLKDADIEAKLSDLNKKYMIAARSGNGALADQIVVMINHYKDEQRRRYQEEMQKALKKQDKDFDDLINFD